MLAGRVGQTPDGHQHSSWLHLDLSSSQPGLLSGVRCAHMESTRVQRSCAEGDREVAEAESQARVGRRPLAS